MKKVENGDYVKVLYTGKYDNGDVFDSNEGCEPFEVHIGSREVIPGFENALIGMSANEKKTFTLAASEAYGERDDSLEKSFQRSDFPDDFQPEVGQVIVLQSSQEGQFPATVKSIETDSVILDLNHPLAGKSLTFDVQVIEVNDKPTVSPCTSGCSSCGCGGSCS
ncbi:FKBP-type peptidyl-prolyl cis-trans isomerase [Desulforhabdus amnigena]|uniref:Peptidyl-prolyl cis-trans isomerase n=1 Tax=Desulforhabdus amnigena TaxID=40218 RepID=A0A9W6FV36_9BACT|nr:peptidylprolyl isomerase [Desulforhabdus amnigena]NLJ28157.1 peptidylprolyl isomerase [Deltaproteobacteria bacterium]GLI35451.1 peptidyl-prolyl cis-trans isomerase [Desulforhabdus amnigena]